MTKAVSRRVIIIEDNHDTADSLATLLRMIGHGVEVAYSGEDGIQAAIRCRPDAVISDINLPGLDGWEVARQLRARPSTANTRLIAVTAYCDDDAEHRAKDSGFDHLLIKPANPGSLLRLLVS
jgi:CheY-like chemotaxis protein